LSVNVKRRLLIALALIFTVATGVSFALAWNTPCIGDDVVGHHIFTSPDHPEFDLVAGDTPEEAVVKFLTLVEDKGGVDAGDLTATQLEDLTYVVRGGRIQMLVSQVEDKFVVTSSRFCPEDDVPSLFAEEP
jgi:hypothetical protein